MQIIEPRPLTLVSTDVAASAYDEWDTDVTYALGNNVVVTDTVPHHEYEALRETTGDAPATSTSDWLDLGVTNQYRMLDDSISTPTTALEEFTVVLASPGRCTHLALFGLDGVVSVTVAVAPATGEATTWTATFSMARLEDPQDWWEYFFLEAEYGTSMVREIEAWYPAPEITVTCEGDTGVTIGVGHLALGVARDLGASLYGARAGIQDYSRKEADAWGNIVLVERAYAQTLSLTIRLEDAGVDRLAGILARLRATPAVYDANSEYTDRDALRLFGFFRDFGITMEDYNGTICSLDIEGLT